LYCKFVEVGFRVFKFSSFWFLVLFIRYC
jgi:hypothetical protein